LISANKFLPGASGQSGDHEHDGRNPRTHAARNRIARAPAAGYQPVRPQLTIRGRVKEKNCAHHNVINIMMIARRASAMSA